MTRRRKVKLAGGVAAVLAVLIPGAIQLDRWLIERRQMINRMLFEEAVKECEAHGGRWWRGDCVFDEPDR